MAPTKLLVALLLVVGVAACGGDDDDSASTTSTTTISTTTQPTTTVQPATSRTTSTSPTTVPSTSVTAAPPVVPACDTTRTWGTEAWDSLTMIPAELYRVRIGRHDCYDRVVFDIDGVLPGAEVAGYHVSYVDGDVLADASGEPIPTAGAVSLQVVVRAPAAGYNPDNQRVPLLAHVGHDLYTEGALRRWPTFREITFAGSFEGQSTFAIGLDARLPFCVGSFERDGRTHVYVDVAHP